MCLVNEVLEQNGPETFHNYLLDEAKKNGTTLTLSLSKDFTDNGKMDLSDAKTVLNKAKDLFKGDNKTNFPLIYWKPVAGDKSGSMWPLLTMWVQTALNTLKVPDNSGKALAVDGAYRSLAQKNSRTDSRTMQSVKAFQEFVNTKVAEHNSAVTDQKDKRAPLAVDGFAGNNTIQWLSSALENGRTYTKPTISIPLAPNPVITDPFQIPWLVIPGAPWDTLPIPAAPVAPEAPNTNKFYDVNGKEVYGAKLEINGSDGRFTSHWSTTRFKVEIVDGVVKFNNYVLIWPNGENLNEPIKIPESNKQEFFTLLDAINQTESYVYYSGKKGNKFYCTWNYAVGDIKVESDWGGGTTAIGKRDRLKQVEGNYKDNLVDYLNARFYKNGSINSRNEGVAEHAQDVQRTVSSISSKMDMEESFLDGKENAGNTFSQYQLGRAKSIAIAISDFGVQNLLNQNWSNCIKFWKTGGTRTESSKKLFEVDQGKSFATYINLDEDLATIKKNIWL
jgi:hypothetical protein